jgi:hypothetical protein
MSWPPPESFWQQLDLPAGGDIARFRAEVDAAAAAYLRNERVDEPFVTIADALQDLDALAHAIRELGSTPVEQLPGQHRPQCLDRIDALALYDLRKYARGVLANARYFGTKRRRQHKFDFDLIWAMQRAGIKLSDSDDGPGNRIFRAITGRLRARPLSSGGARKIFREEIKARARYARGDH